MAKQDWIWMPHPGHFICASECKFFLNTKVGNYIVSTVGEFLPEEGVREIYAKSKGIRLEGRGDDRRWSFIKQHGYAEVGCNRLYETMVFPTVKRPKESCRPWDADVSEGEADFQGYNDPLLAYKGHLELCEKWDEKGK